MMTSETLHPKQPQEYSAHHIPQSFIRELLEKTDLLELMMELSDRASKKIGNHYTMLCLFHTEKTPSLNINRSQNFYYCYGCHEHGNAIHFLRNFSNMSFLESVRYLAKRIGITLPNDVSKTNSKTTKANTQAYTLLKEAAQFYNSQLSKHSEAIHYLTSRKIDTSSIKKFMLGYAPPQWQHLEKQFPNQQPLLLSQGLVIKKENGNSFDKFRDRIMFPIHNTQGNIIAFGARSLNNDNLPKYMNSPETPLFHKRNELYGLYDIIQSRRKIEKILVVEGYMDVIALHQHHIYYSVATLGTAISLNQLKKLRHYTKKIIFCFDGDDAGRAAAWRALLTILPILHDDTDIQFLFPPHNEDPDSLIRKIGKVQFEKLFDSAIPLSQAFIDYMKAETPIHSIENQAQFAKTALSHLQKMPKGLFYELLLKQLADTVSLNVARFKNLASKQIQSNVSSTITSRRKSSITHDQHGMLPPAYVALSLLLKDTTLAKRVVLSPNDFIKMGVPGASLLFKLTDHFKINRTASVGEILAHWPEREESNLIARMAARTISLSKPESITAEFDGAIARMKEQQVDLLLDILIKKSKKTELSQTEKEELRTLLKQNRKQSTDKITIET